jgi:two-component system CheB/CheR fusion protein
VLYLHGRTGRYLEPAPGELDSSITKMAREGLRRELTTALHKAATTRAAVHEPGLRVKTNGDYSVVDLTIVPLGGDGQPPLFLVVFDEPTGAAPPAEPQPLPSGPNEASADAMVEALKHELRLKEDFLETTIEELETSNEELRSASEEMQSTNEELQSTNEELETSKEELQSTNEELTTVNAELREKIVELTRMSNDLSNLLAGTGIATVFVDHQLRVQRFTPAATQIINLIPADVGRSVGHIVSNLIGYDRLVEDIQAVLEDLVPKEIEVETKLGAWFSLRIRPYRTLENVIEGAVISFLDITTSKRAELTSRALEALRRSALDPKPPPPTE